MNSSQLASRFLALGSSECNVKQRSIPYFVNSQRKQLGSNRGALKFLLLERTVKHSIMFACLIGPFQWLVRIMEGKRKKGVSYLFLEGGC